MQVEASHGTLSVKAGKRFAGPEAARLAEAFGAFSPLTRVTLDFTGVEAFEEQAVVSLARALGALRGARVVIRGLAPEQHRRFRALGVLGAEIEDLPGATARLSTARGKPKP